MHTVTLELIPQMKDGDRQAFNEIFERYWPELVNLARKKAGPHRDAEGIAQSAAFSFWNRMTNKGGFPVLEDSQDLKRILAWITICKAYDVVVSETGPKHKLTEEAIAELLKKVSQSPTPEDVAMYNELRERLAERLSPDERRVLDLREEGFTYDEIAKKLDWPLNPVKAAIRQIQRRLEEFQAEESRLGGEQLR